jgi:hypothetical protein
MEDGPFYFLVVNHRMAVRLEPSLNSPWSSEVVLNVGEVHEASQRIRDGDSQIFYRLANNSGWAFKHTADGDETAKEIPRPYFT